jgi:hypothetical protein
MNIVLIRKVLNELLLLKDGEDMPYLCGVCYELGVASVKAENFEGFVSGTKEYQWANKLAGFDYVDKRGYMTPIRRSFVYKLLTELDKLECSN